MEQLHARTPDYAFHAESYREGELWRAGLAAALRDALALPSMEGGLAPPVLLERTDCGTYIREHMEMATAPHLTMPFYLLTPKEAQPLYPAVLACPGHGYGYKQLLGLLPDGTARTGEPGLYKDYPAELARRGMMVIVPELLGLGDRRLERDRDKEPEANSCFSLAMNLLMAGKTLAGFRVHEMMRCIDYVLSRGDVAPERIGCMGFSGGGFVCALTAALDERIAATVISGYTNTFRDSTMAKPHCSDNYVPGLQRLAEMPDIWGLIAPRPLLIESGEADAGFPLYGALKAIGRLEDVYRAAGAEASLFKDIHPGKHEISGAVAFDWLQDRLGAG
ncbi:alpha/beta hydrolase family protein [Cohnella zeiphila]|uniref:Dienelactone hydrolase family protein n=1 Tax=Cohnella zeiphila TaxID=2761120 RepID=A0A7X0SQ03_9BACL|nr:alpha/beta hydrolase family protein [Cohnella zeiphila]MBB6733966.1 dienelactone hydrolase family protein [Cohnella zeiphila]